MAYSIFLGFDQESCSCRGGLVRYSIVISIFLILGLGWYAFQIKLRYTTPKELSESTLRCMSNTGFRSGIVQWISSDEYVAFEENDPEFGEILKALFIKAHPVDLNLEGPEVLVVYEAGMDPTTIPVFFLSNSVFFICDEVSYESADQRMKTLLASRTNRVSSSRDYSWP